MPKLFVHALRAHDLCLDPEDHLVPGVYEIGVSEELPQELHRAAALAGFHSREPVVVLDDFDFEVRDAFGRLCEHDEAAKIDHAKLSDDEYLNGFVISASKVSGADAPRKLLSFTEQLRTLRPFVRMAGAGGRAA